MLPILLFVPYVLVVTPVGLASRLIHDPLTRRRRRRAETYWVTRLAGCDLPEEAPLR